MSEASWPITDAVTVFRIDQLRDTTHTVERDIYEVIGNVEKSISSDKRLRFRSRIVSARDSCIAKLRKSRTEVAPSIESYIGTLSQETSTFTSDQQWVARFHELGKETGKRFRRVELVRPSSKKVFRAALWWMAEHGEEEDLDLLRHLQRGPRYASDMAIQRLLSIAVQRIGERVDDPDYIFEQGEAAYQQHKEEWDNRYAGQSIAIYRGAVVDNDEDESKLIDRIMQKQQEKGPFRAYIVRIGTSVLQARGPRATCPTETQP